MAAKKSAYITINGMRPLCEMGVVQRDKIQETIGEYPVCGHASIASAKRQARLIREKTAYLPKVVVGVCPSMDE